MHRTKYLRLQCPQRRASLPKRPLSEAKLSHRQEEKTVPKNSRNVKVQQSVLYQVVQMVAMLQELQNNTNQVRDLKHRDTIHRYLNFSAIKKVLQTHCSKETDTFGQTNMFLKAKVHKQLLKSAYICLIFIVNLGNHASDIYQPWSRYIISLLC